ncbi:nuclear transcription factor Y subunit B-1-like [Bidens hawaiensis]|uniref:nuclear transcription factor Y subunit B-1-like n=1 Tax=Bidens hawaiensis TaxID=980011 RepID=UPI00404B45FA
MADAPGSPADSGGDQSPRSNSNIREQDRFLPIANISRIMKKALPANGKIAKDAKDTVQECVSEFISFVTSEASDKCLKEKRKTINGDDLLWAMATLGFEDYIDPLKGYLSRYREVHRILVTYCFLDSYLLYSTKVFSFFFGLMLDAYVEYSSTQLEGDTKGSGKKDTVGSQVVPNAQYTHQGPYTQGMNYLNSHV